MGKLTFQVTDALKQIVDHAAANDPGPFYGETIERCVFLVKDEGAYLMSGGKPGLIHPEKGAPRQLVVYADGHNPDTGDYDWDFTRSICGGDDFVEPLDLPFIQRAIARGAKTITVSLTDDAIALEA